VLPESKIGTKAFWTKLQRDLVDQLVRSRQLELPANRQLKLVARPGETAEAFATRCLQAADERADAEIAKLKDTYETRFNRLREQLRTAENRADVLKEEREGKRNEEVLSTAGSILGGLLGGRKRNVLGKLGGAARSRGTTKAARERVAAAEGKVARMVDELEELEAELADEVTEIDARWMATAKDVTTVAITLERSDVTVADLCLAWLPVD
jgi:hypothetical protein